MDGFLVNERTGAVKGCSSYTLEAAARDGCRLFTGSSGFVEALAYGRAIQEREERLSNLEQMAQNQTFQNNEFINEQNRLIEEQNYQNEQILREIQENNRILSEQAEISEREAYKATFQQRNAQLDQLYDEVDNYARKNNMVRVYVCLPENIITRHNRIYGIEYGIPLFDLLYMLKNYRLPSFFMGYQITDRFVDATTFGMTYCINIPKKGIKKIKKSNKMQKYFSDNNKNDMIAIKYYNGYVIISPENFSRTGDEGNQDKIVKVGNAPYIVWLKEEELLPFLRSYNDLINNEKKELWAKAKKYDRNDNIYYIKNIVKTIYPFIIFGIIILILFQMCK
jgi:hypothetical protein